MPSLRLAMLAPALTLALPAPAEATIRVSACGSLSAIEIPLHRDGDDAPPEKCFAACHALGCGRSNRARSRR